MTEAEWQNADDPRKMLDHLRDQALFRTRWQGWVQVRRWRTSERKLRLFACACCRRFSPDVLGPELEAVVRLAERQAEGEVEFTAVENALAHAERACRRQGDEGDARVADWRLVGAVACLARRDVNEAVVAWEAIGRLFGPGSPSSDFTPQALAEFAGQAALLREVVGNPFAPPQRDPAWLAANDQAVARIARGIQAERAFGDLPVLADALEEAGCADRSVLGHCRGPGPHAPGCWVVDWVLNRE
jgi:hypothetical protein